MKFRFVAAALAFTLSAAAGAQTAPISRTIPITFNGVVSSTAADTLLVRQPDGSLATYTGPLPTLSYARGDPVTISFNATVPTRAFYDSPTYAGQIAADGIYRITVSSPYYNGGTLPGGIGNSAPADVSGPINPELNSGQPTNTRMTLVYDYNSDSYSIEGGGGFASGAYAGPGYVYDASSGTYVACSGAVQCAASASANPVIFGLSGGADGTTVASSGVRVNSTNPQSGAGTGLFSWLFSGSWNLPQYNGSPTSVPEPGVLLLFGAASGVLVRRRMKKRSG